MSFLISQLASMPLMAVEALSDDEPDAEPDKAAGAKAAKAGKTPAIKAKAKAKSSAKVKGSVKPKEKNKSKAKGPAKNVDQGSGEPLASVVQGASDGSVQRKQASESKKPTKKPAAADPEPGKIKAYKARYSTQGRCHWRIKHRGSQVLTAAWRTFAQVLHVAELLIAVVLIGI